MSDLNRPIHLFVSETFYAANGDRDSAAFGTRLELIRWRARERRLRGRVRVLPGYRLAPPSPGKDLTAPRVRDFWLGNQPAEPSSR